MDDERRTEWQPSQPSEPKREQKRKGEFWPALFGALLGGAIVFALMTYAAGLSADDSAVQSAKTENTPDSQHVQIPMDISSEVTDVVDEVATAVVGITNIQTVQDFWSARKTTQEAGSGSGVIYKKSGDKAYIVTNHHVVENSEQLEVTFDDGTKTEGKLIGSDLWTDLAVVEIDAKDVDAVVEFGDSDTLKRGESVIAIGNPLGLGFAGSVTVGVISGKDRSIPMDLNKDGIIDWQADVLQTDAAINPGNSGGALINMAGQLIGINSMKISQETVEGIGLAIPINIALPIIEHLEETGQVNRPTMGVSLLDLQQIPIQQQQQTLKLPKDITEGVVVTDIMSNSPAVAAGMEKYDTIVQLDEEKVTDMVSLRKYLYNKKEIGDQLKVTVYRDGKKMELEMVLKDGNTF
ncbi:2-alkenal reductase [Sporosarcina sp. P37]|uniref:S1C family serine protease n=1 Tax=unclassified Sporosarcina TaxID=2647733 RepID=UPI0009C05A55|nr:MULTISPECIES: trypsin-like peptidase domain-containing protein [unclassified Sporosarcina]ARD48369.1 2-alkenal reductase [Sporosarcina sp. P33]ARK24871.1 2-alkenal reductase [Sporosarcina sp. P37]PID20029.1 2-alkenal reductase [Sporosarcina sp. P35]